MKRILLALLLSAIAGAGTDLKAQNKLYGLTTLGGSNNGGVIYSTDANGSNYVVVHSFEAATGIKPLSKLTLADNGKLYGTTSEGGQNGDGTIFEFDPSNNTFTKTKDFESTTNGSIPYGKMIEVNALLYGTASAGGTDNKGVVFSYDYTNNLMDIIHEFSGTDGELPSGGLVMASNGLLYGITGLGGLNGLGTIYTINPADNSFIKVHNFSDGSVPLDELEPGDSGLLYGTTLNGGANNDGVIFSINPIDYAYSKIFDLNAASSGEGLSGGLTKAFNGKLYGIARRGSSTTGTQHGTLIEYNPMNNTVTKKLNFGSGNGKRPNSKLFLSSNGNLYGTTEQGGDNGFGTWFEYDPYQNILTKILDFDGTNGSSPTYNGMVEIFESNVPFITRDLSSNVTICQGETLELFVAASGPDLTYQWQRNGYDLAGATSSFYRVEDITHGYNGSYVCLVTNSYGTATSTATSLSVTVIPSLSLAEIPDHTYGDPVYELDFSTEGGTVEWASSNPEAATVNEGNVSIVGAGTTTIIGTISNSCFTRASEQTLIVNKASHELTFTSLEPVTYGDAAITLSASSSEGVPVTFSASDENVATISGNTLTIVGAGESTVTARSENSNYTLATNTQTLTVNKADQSIMFETLPEVIGGLSYDLAASASSGLEVTYTSSNTDVANIEENRLHVHDLGEVVITAHQAGNRNYNSTSEHQTLTISKVLEVSVATQATILPNPASYSLEVSGMELGASNLTVYDLQGQVRYNQTLKNEKQISIDISNYPVGMYLLKINSGQKVDIHKFYKSEAYN